MAILNPQLSTVTVNVSGLSLSLKRQTVARWIKKTKDPIYAASKTFTSSKDKQAKIKGIEGDTPSK